jgi:cobalt-zinc-cadmium efflux system membrane fusion protein
VFPRDRARLATGQVVAVRAVDGGPHGSGSLVSISPAMTAGAQNLTARVALDNADGRWSPGAFVSGSVAVAETAAALVVPNSALQSCRAFTVVFAKVGETYEVRMLELGDSDGEATVVLGGLEPGTTIVTGNSYLIKADIEKSGASHDH